MSKDDDTKPYNVGFGKPPKEGQFKKGKSGNPTGRPKGSKKIRSALDFARGIIDIADSPIIVKDKGESKEVSLFEAIIMKQAYMAAKGNQRAASFMLKAVTEAQKEEIKTHDEIIILMDNIATFTKNAKPEDYKKMGISMKEHFEAFETLSEKV